MLTEVVFAVFICVSAILCQTVTNASGENNIKVIIDNDAGDDDAVGIFLALLFEKYFNGPKVIGLTTTNGNTNEDNVSLNNQKILKVAKRQDIPIYRGSKSSILITRHASGQRGDDGLGDNDEYTNGLVAPSKQNAVWALIEQSKEHRVFIVATSVTDVVEAQHVTGKIADRETFTHSGRVPIGALYVCVSHDAALSIKRNLKVITLGPLTNIALAMKIDPHFLGRLNHLYIGAGYIHSDVYPLAETNSRMDSEAYHIVAQNATPDKVTVLPYSQVQISLNSTTKVWRDTVLGAIDTDIIKALNVFEKKKQREQKWRPLDPTNVAIAIKPDLVEEYKYSKNDIILNGDKRGTMTNHFVEKLDANIRMAYAVKENEFKQFLLSIFSADLNPEQ